MVKHLQRIGVGEYSITRGKNRFFRLMRYRGSIGKREVKIGTKKYEEPDRWTRLQARKPLRAFYEMGLEESTV